MPLYELPRCKCLLIAVATLLALGCRPTPPSSQPAAGGGAAPSSSEASAALLAMTGDRLTHAEVLLLEESVGKDPQAIEARTKLLGYYFRKRSTDKEARKAANKHVLWLIEHSPRSPVLGTPYGELRSFPDPVVYVRAQEAWEEQLAKHPSDVSILSNFASFIRDTDDERALEALEKAHSLDSSNPEWPRRIGELHRLAMIGASPEARAKSAALALKYFELAYERASEMERWLLQRPMARTALAANELEKARENAEKMLKPRGTLQKVDGADLHDGNLVLGLLSLRAGDVNGAKAHLLAAGETSGAPTLMSFGPSMSLAHELLKVGEKDVVLEYLEQCSKFWTHDRGQLKRWSALIKVGEAPDFGNNLVY